MSDLRWPDPERPGVPLNPERDGWHWLADEDGAVVPRYWLAECEVWGAAWTTQKAAKHWRYVGPGLTPDEVAASKAAAWCAGRDAAAEVCVFFVENTSAYNTIRALTPPAGQSDALAAALRDAEHRGMMRAAEIAFEAGAGDELVERVALAIEGFFCGADKAYGEHKKAARAALVAVREAADG